MPDKKTQTGMPSHDSASLKTPTDDDRYASSTTLESNKGLLDKDRPREKSSILVGWEGPDDAGETCRFSYREEIVHHHHARANDNVRDLRFVSIQHVNHSNSKKFHVSRGGGDPSNQSIRTRLRLWPNNLWSTLRIIRAEATDVSGHVSLRNLPDPRGYTPEPEENLHMSLTGRGICE
ncbi:hypothetical protein PENANT_c003G07420 [Penicillium antarcticum]|uniref:Uncharacterized protein n=1 Tax=Penicillium antarcticum TaxID=416450 RepID=A0A1V6QHG7_9EURO|nr:hypothetical protein PENANT_c003G07420 [Penicillium antarcticum]